MQITGSCLSDSQREAIIGQPWNSKTASEYQDFTHNMSLAAQRGAEAIEADTQIKNMLISGLKTFATAE